MALRKRSSKILDKAERRAAALKSISLNLDLGNGLTVDRFVTLIDDTRSKLAAYNMILSTIDKARNDVIEAEQTLADLAELMLLGVASKYGKNSNEYEMAGGVRKANRKRSTTAKIMIPTISA